MTSKFCGGLQAEAKRCDATAFTKAHRSQQLAQKFEPASRIILVQLLANFPNVEIALAHQSGGNFKRARAGFWILERPGIG